MINGVRDFYYNAQDMKRAVRFYSEVLGMKIGYEDKYWVSLKCGESMIGLHWTEGKPVADVPRDSHGAHGGGTLTLRSTNIDEDEKHLRAHDVKILGRINAEWGKIVIFEDPEGNVLKLMQD